MIFLPLLFLQIIFLIVWYLIIFKTKKGFFSFARRSLWRSLGCVLACIILVLLCMSYKETFKQVGVIKTEAVLYAGPGEDYHKLGNVANDTVEIKQKFGDWLKIHYNNVSGWIKANDIQEFY